LTDYLQEIELYFELKGTPESSQESYRRRIHAFITFIQEKHSTLDEITEKDIQQYILFLKRKKGLSDPADQVSAFFSADYCSALACNPTGILVSASTAAIARAVYQTIYQARTPINAYGSHWCSSFHHLVLFFPLSYQQSNL
jgi:hypothetical protein